MTLLDELREKESKLAAQVGPLKEQYERLATELAMVRHGITMLTVPQGEKRGRGRLSDAVLDRVEAMRSEGRPWAEIGRDLGLSVAAVTKAVERRRKGNPHLKAAHSRKNMV